MPWVGITCLLPLCGFQESNQNQQASAASAFLPSCLTGRIFFSIFYFYCGNFLMSKSHIHITWVWYLPIYDKSCFSVPRSFGKHFIYSSVISYMNEMQLEDIYSPSSNIPWACPSHNPSQLNIFSLLYNLLGPVGAAICTWDRASPTGAWETN